jgi:drug/metabolite transporter (DMT)-like permease
MSERHAKGLGAVLLGATILGLAALFVKWAAQGGASDFVIGFYRMLVALPGAWLLARREEEGASHADGRLWAMAAGGAFFLDLWGWHLAMRHTSAANATLLVGGLSPIWVALFSMAILHLRYGWMGWTGQIVGLGGALVLALARGARVGSGKGEAIAIVASFAYASFTLLLGRARRDLKAPQALFWMSLGCLFCFAIAALLRGDAFCGFSTAAWASLLALGLVIQLLAWWLNSWGLGHVEASLGAIGLQMQQVTTLLLAAIFLHEPLRPLGLLGAGLIITGIVLVASSPKRVAARSAS